MTTTVKEVIERLQEFDPSLPIITSIDDEGNGYRFTNLDWINMEGYEEVDGEIEVGKIRLSEQERADGWTDEDIKPNPCVVIG